MARQSAIYGEKHPNIVQAKSELQAAGMRFKAALITRGEPSPTPSSKDMVLLGLAFLLALISGIGLAVWFDRRRANRLAEDSLLANK